MGNSTIKAPDSRIGIQTALLSLGSPVELTEIGKVWH
jgi:hypothetical protein